MIQQKSQNDVVTFLSKLARKSTLFHDTDMAYCLKTYSHVVDVYSTIENLC